MSVIVNTSQQTILADRADVARSLAQRVVGLLSRAALADGQALVIPGCGSIHTCFMRFPIDVVFLRRGQAVKIVHALPPFRLARAAGADAVIELPAGCASRAGLSVGQRFEVLPQ